MLQKVRDQSLGLQRVLRPDGGQGTTGAAKLRNGVWFWLGSGVKVAIHSQIKEEKKHKHILKQKSKRKKQLKKKTLQVIVAIGNWNCC